jgi:DNA polymerase III delta prime subunit
VAGKSINWKYLVAQDRVKEILGSAFLSGNLAHAYLLCGDEGVGKFAAALDMAMALLCTSKGNVPCHTCSSCRKVLSYNHPDLHVLLPIPLGKGIKSDDDLTEKGWDLITSKIRAKISDPYLPLTFEKEESGEDEGDRKDTYKRPIIPRDLIREFDHAIMRGAVESKCNVGIMYDMDIMRRESQSTLLKTLEEPPVNTYLFLTSCKPEALLPTVFSRCQIVRFGHVPTQQIKNELTAKYPSVANDVELTNAVFYSMGSLGRALTQIATEESAKGLKTLQETAQEVKDFWDLCCTGDWLTVAPAINEIIKERNQAVHEQFLNYMLYLIRNTFLQKSGRSENYIDGSNVLADPNGIFNDPAATDRLTRACNEALSGVRKYGHIGIILVNFVTTLMEILHVEKQQTC